MDSTRVLVVDDHEDLRHMLSLALSKDGFHVWTAASGREALDMLKTSNERFDVCVTDVRMSGMDGLAFIQDASKRLGERAPTFIAMSAYGDRQLAVEALRRGAFDYISKPFDPAELCLKLRLVVERNRLTGEHAPRPKQAPPARPVATTKGGQTKLEDIVIASPQMQAIARTVRKVASFPTAVLITGETGTGKEKIAAAIHSEGPRANKSFIAVNCGAIPENLLESELFGHVKGAFTDASTDKVGLFETATGGTLFLDEIAELPPQLQVKLLRVLAEGEIRRLGSTATIPVDVRVITATSSDLERARREGRFRDDLFHRLNVVSIHVPPLRDRVEEIRPLVEHFCRRFEARLSIEKLEVGEDALAILERYPWPGNVRELENSLERAFVLSESGGQITEADLDERFLAAAAATASDAAGRDAMPRSVSAAEAPAFASGPSAPGAEPELNLKVRLAELERDIIKKALERTGGNRSRAATLLGISHRALLYKLKEYGIT